MDFLVKKIKNTYSGYKDKIDDSAFNILIDSISRCPSSDTFRNLSIITLYFKDYHLKLYDLNLKRETDTINCKGIAVNVIKYLDTNKIKNDIYEGYWLSDMNDCVMGLVKISDKPLMYKGYIVQSKNNSFIGYNNCVLEFTGDNHILTDYKNIIEGYRVFTYGHFKTEKIFRAGAWGGWRKLDSVYPFMLNSLITIDLKPSLTKIDNHNLLITLPDFSVNNVRLVDSLIESNKETILLTENLIIDIRYNLGGTIRNYLPLVPFITTGDIIRAGDSILCSNELVENLEKTIKARYLRNDTLRISRVEKKLSLVRENIGKVAFYAGDTLYNNVTKMYPKNVAIITNYASLSAAELMLLDFKQSKKVTIFGETTGGALDYLDDFYIKLPSQKYILDLATTKRIKIKNYGSFDKTGFQPDVIISDEVKDWVEFVKLYYERKN